MPLVFLAAGFNNFTIMLWITIIKCFYNNNLNTISLIVVYVRSSLEVVYVY